MYEIALMCKFLSCWQQVEGAKEWFVCCYVILTQISEYAIHKKALCCKLHIIINKISPKSLITWFYRVRLNSYSLGYSSADLDNKEHSDTAFIKHRSYSLQTFACQITSLFYFPLFVMCVQLFTAVFLSMWFMTKKNPTLF